MAFGLREISMPQGLKKFPATSLAMCEEFRRQLLALISSDPAESVRIGNQLCSSPETLFFCVEELQRNELPVNVLEWLPPLMQRTFPTVRRAGGSVSERLAGAFYNLLLNPTPFVCNCIGMLQNQFAVLSRFHQVDMTPLLEYTKLVLKQDEPLHTYALHLLLIIMDYYRSSGEPSEKTEDIFRFAHEAFSGILSVENIMTGKGFRQISIFTTSLPGILKFWWNIGMSPQSISNLLQLVCQVIEVLSQVPQPITSDEVRYCVSRLLDIVFNTLKVRVFMTPGEKQHLLELRQMDLYRDYYVHLIHGIPHCVRVFATDCHLQAATEMLQIVASEFGQVPLSENEVHELLDLLHLSSQLPKSCLEDFTDNPSMFYVSAYICLETELRSIACSFISLLSLELFNQEIALLMNSPPSEGRIRLTAKLCSVAKKKQELDESSKEHLVGLVDQVISQDVEYPIPAIITYSKLFLLAKALWLRPDPENIRRVVYEIERNNLMCSELPIEDGVEQFDTVRFSLGCALWKAAVKCGEMCPAELVPYLIARRDLCLSSDIWFLIANGSYQFVDQPPQIIPVLNAFFARIVFIHIENGLLSTREAKNLNVCYNLVASFYEKAGVLINLEGLLELWRRLIENDCETYQFFLMLQRLCYVGVKGMLGVIGTFPQYERDNNVCECDNESIMMTILVFLDWYAEEQPPAREFLEYCWTKFRDQWQSALEEVDLYLLCQIAASMIQRRWVPPECVEYVVQVGRQLVQCDPSERPTTAIAAFSLLVSAKLFYNVDVLDENFLKVWEGLLRSHGLFSHKEAALYKAFFLTVEGPNRDVALELLKQAVDNFDPQTSDVDELIVKLGGLDVPPHLSEKLARL